MRQHTTYYFVQSFRVVILDETVDRGRKKGIPGISKEPAAGTVESTPDHLFRLATYRSTRKQEPVREKSGCLQTRSNVAVTAGASASEPNWGTGSLLPTSGGIHAIVIRPGVRGYVPKRSKRWEGGGTGDDADAEDHQPPGPSGGRYEGQAVRDVLLSNEKSSESQHGWHGHRRSDGIRGADVRNCTTQIRRGDSFRGSGGDETFSSKWRSSRRTPYRRPSSLCVHTRRSHRPIETGPTRARGRRLGMISTTKNTRKI